MKVINFLLKVSQYGEGKKGMNENSDFELVLTQTVANHNLHIDRHIHDIIDL